MGLDKIWADESSRVIEVLGGEPQKYKRKVEDKLQLSFTMKQWRAIFNISEDYLASTTEYTAYAEDRPIVIHFVRRVTDERT